jgi:hypothetical protein
MNQSSGYRIALVFMLLLLGIFTHAQVIPNGDFTGPSSTTYNGWAPPGWTTTIQSPDTWAAGPGPNGHNAPASPNGGTYIRTNSYGPEGIIATITGMTIGVPMTLDFWYGESCIALNPNAGGGRYNITMFGVSQGPAFLPCTTPAVWYPGSVTFLPTATSGTIEIRTQYVAGHSHSLFDGLRIGTVLPIEDLEFWAIPQEDRTVDLKWSTGKEISSDFFELQRSEDGLAWEYLDKQTSAGNAQVGHAYEFTDINPFFGKSFYRLREVGQDGRSSYSDVQTVDFGQPLPGSVMVYPNPASNRISVVASAEELKALRVFDLAGKNLTEVVKIIQMSDLRSEVDLVDLPAGVYLIKTATTAERVRKN